MEGKSPLPKDATEFENENIEVSDFKPTVKESLEQTLFKKDSEINGFASASAIESLHNANSDFLTCIPPEMIKEKVAREVQINDKMNDSLIPDNLESPPEQSVHESNLKISTVKPEQNSISNGSYFKDPDDINVDPDMFIV